MKKANIKGFIAGVLITVLIMAMANTVFAAQLSKTITAVYNDIKITIDGKQITPVDANGNPVEPFISDGTTYLPVRSVASAIGYGVSWDGNTNTVSLTSSALKAELDNYAPVKNKTVNLIVSGDGFAGLPYTAIVYYKTTQTEYPGTVGTPCPIKVSSATPDFEVLVYICVTDAANNKIYKLYTSFTPTE